MDNNLIDDIDINDVDTDWTHTDTDEYYRDYKGLELFIKVKRDYSRLYIWHPREPLEEWFDGRIRGDYKDEVERRSEASGSQSGYVGGDDSARLFGYARRRPKALFDDSGVTQ